MSDLVIQQNIDLTHLNTFGLSAVARYYARPSNVAELIQVFEFINEHSLDYLVLGGGSNLLFRHPRFDGVIIHLNFQGIQLIEGEDDFRVSVAASQEWHAFVLYAIGQGIIGLENLSLIPGSVGACPVQNIGAYGVEVAEFVDSVVCFDPKACNEVVLTRDECRFGYRDSIFKHEATDLIITKVNFLFSKECSLRLGYGDVAKRVEERLREGRDAQVNAALVSQVICDIRNEKLPNPGVLGNAGSFFKNPIVEAAQYERLKSAFPDLVAYPYAEKFKLAAGWMIDKLGLKGSSVGGASVHEKQALVLVNRSGQATAEELFELVGKIQLAVAEAFGVELEVEPRIV